MVCASIAGEDSNLVADSETGASGEGSFAVSVEITGGEPFEAEVDDYLKSVRLVELAYQSAQSGLPVSTAEDPSTASQT